jgi:hypothetical protein
LAIGVVFLAFALRLVASGGVDLGFDGGLSVALGVVPLSTALDFLAHDVHPPLAYILLRGWIALVGTTPFAVKIGGTVVGVLTVAVVVAWARELVGRSSAPIAGLLVALAPAAVEISVSPREYAIAFLLIVLTARAYTRWDQGGRRWFVIWGSLALWTSYLTAGLLLATGLDTRVRGGRRGRSRDVLLVGATILPWLLFVLVRGFAGTLGSAGPSQGGAGQSLPAQLRDLARVLSGGEILRPSWLGPALYATAVLLIVASLVASHRSIRKRGAGGLLRNEAPFFALVFGASLVLAIGVNTFWTRSGLPARYVLPAVPFLAIAFAAGVRAAPPFPRLLATGLVVVATAAGTYAWLRRPPLPPSFWDPTALVRYLDQRVAPRDLVVFLSPEQAGYYRALSRQPRPWVLISADTNYLEGDVTNRTKEALAPRIGDAGVFWLVLYRPALGEGTTKVVDWLSANAFPETTTRLPDSDIAPFIASGPVDSSRAVGARLDGGIELVAANWATAVGPGQPLPIELDWRARQPISRNLTVFVHLADAREKLIAQDDSIPEGGRAPTTVWKPAEVIVDRHGLSLPRDLPPGAYWIEVGLYDGKGRLHLEAGGDTIRLGPIDVTSVARPPS